MSRSASSSPLRKKQRLSSPTYDDHFAELDTRDFQLLDDIEAGHSQGTTLSSPSRIFWHNGADRKGRRRHAIEDALKFIEFADHDDSGIVLVGPDNGDGSPERTLFAKSPRPSSSHSIGFASTAALPFVAEAPGAFSPHATGPDTVSASFLPVSLMTPGIGLNANSRRSPSPDATSEPNHDAWFTPVGDSSATGFSAVSTLPNLLKERIGDIAGFDTPGLSPALLERLQHRTAPTWASPSAAALERARGKLKVWESEIEEELFTVEQEHPTPSNVTENKQLSTFREPLKDVENSLPSTVGPGVALPTLGSTAHDSHPAAPPRLFKAPAFTALRHNNNINTPSRSSQPPQPTLFNPILARSSAAAAETVLSGVPTTCYNSTPVTPVRPNSTARPSLQTTDQSVSLTSFRPSGTSQPQGRTPQKPRALGLTPRAHAFTGSKARPKFVTPFKREVKPQENSKNLQLQPSQPMMQMYPQYNDKGKGREEVPSSTKEVKTQVIWPDKSGLERPEPSIRISLKHSRLVPRSYQHDKLNEAGFDTKLLSLNTLSQFLYYRFNSVDATIAPTTQMSFGSNSALDALLAANCRLATKRWVDNHWALILWKMVGMACLDPVMLEKTWSWDEVMRQLHYRYARELENGSRPALRLITTRDAPASAPLVLCVSDIFWTDETVDAEGQCVLPHPELELTDGWYRLRATVDEPLARATRSSVLRIGRKIACSGAKLESSKKDPMEVLDAYENAHLVLSGNSTHLAPWHAKLGFQRAPFVATLGSLCPDGGAVPLMDLIITQVFPVGFIEFITTQNGDIIREGPRTEKDEAFEEDRWRDRRSRAAEKLQDELEKKMQRLEWYADRLETIAGSEFLPTEDDSPPDNVYDLIEELENGDDPVSVIKRIKKTTAGWLAMSLRKKCESDKEKSGEDIDRELTMACPPRQVRNFRVLRVKDAKTIRKPSRRTAQLTVWDVMSLNVTEGGSPGSFNVGQRYMVSSLVPSQQSAWMGVEDGSEVYLSTRRDSKWKIIH